MPCPDDSSTGAARGYGAKELELNIWVLALAVAIVAAAIAAALLVMAGRFRTRRRRQEAITDLAAQSALSSAAELNTVSRGGARPAFSIVCGYHIDAATAARIRRSPSSGQLVLADRWTPLVTIGATGSGKTTSVIEPAVLEWPGPVLSTSVKHDLATSTHRLRAHLGTVLVFDPSNQLPKSLAGFRGVWTPLAACRTWKGACETAAAMVYAAAAGGSGAGEDFWSTQASSLLSVMLFATASRAGTCMAQVSQLLGKLLEQPARRKGGDDEAEVKLGGFAQLYADLTKIRVGREIAREAKAAAADADGASAGEVAVLEASVAEFDAALESLAPFVSYAEHAPQTIGGVIASLTNVLQVYRFARDVAGARHDDENLIDIDAFLNGDNTIYLVAPPKAQRLYAPLLTAFAEAVISRAYEVAQSRPDGRVPRPLLCALDEVANIAPLPELHSYAATARSYRIMLCLAAQDLSQMKARFGEDRTYSILSCAGTVVILPRTKDPMTLDWASKIAGEIRVPTSSTTRATTTSKSTGKDPSAKTRQAGESESVTESFEWRPLASPARIAAMNDREGLAVVGAHRTQLLQRRAFEDERLKRLAAGDREALPDTARVARRIPGAPAGPLADLSAGDKT